MDKKSVVPVNDFFVGQLVQKLALRFGIATIRSRDCSYISKGIRHAHPLEPVSEKTLLRMIGVDKTFGNLSAASLDYVARYLGFLSFETFVKITKEEKGIGNVPLTANEQKELTLKSINPFLRVLSIHEITDFSFKPVAGFCSCHHENYYLYTHILPQIIENAFEREDVAFLSCFFDLPYIFDAKNYLHFHLWSLMQHFGLSMRNHEKMRVQLLPQYAKHPVAHSFYFEFFVDTDFLALHHDQAIKLYLHQKKTDEASLFGHNLLFLKSFLTLDEKGCTLEIEKLRQIPKTYTLHIIPIARYYGSELLYECFFANGISSGLWETIQNVSKIAVNYKNFDNRPLQFHIKILNALLLCGDYERIEWYINHIVLYDYTLDELIINKDVYLKKLLMYSSLTTFLSGNEVKAKEFFGYVTPLVDVEFEREFEYLHYLVVKHLLYRQKTILKEGMSIAKRLHYSFFENLFTQKLNG